MATERFRKKVLRATLEGKPRSFVAAMAVYAETAERYSDMVEAVKRLPDAGSGPLSVEERNLYSVAYKNVIGARRVSWRTVSSICEKEAKASAEEWQLEEARRYREQLEGELHDLCHEVLGAALVMVGDSDEPASEDDEGCVFFRKMAGDAYRYLAEVQVGDNRSKLAEQAMEQYEQALELARATMSPTHPVNLGLHLNFSVFLYEIANAPARACRLAQRGFLEAVPTLNALSDDVYNDCFVVMQLLRDNLALWTQDVTMQADGTSHALQPGSSAHNGSAGSTVSDDPTEGGDDGSDHEC